VYHQTPVTASRVNGEPFDSRSLLWRLGSRFGVRAHMDQMDKPWKFTAVRAVMALATFMYLPFVLPVAGLPRWSAPWWPSTEGQGVMVLTLIVTFALWADGCFLLPRRSRRKLQSSKFGTGNRFENVALGLFLVRSFLLYSGAPASAGLSLKTHDSRFAIIFATASALLILLLPRPKLRDPGGTCDEGASGT